MSNRKKSIPLPKEGSKVLVHSCCAPCSGAILEWMVQNGIRPAIFFSNSNIYSFEEYELRRSELMRYAEKLGLEVIDDEYDHKAWLEKARDYANEPERGQRCLLCFKFRLERAARYASEHGYSLLTTTLASSRWKDLRQVDEAGTAACSPYDNVDWWGQNWRICGLQERRTAILREESFYNQDFCGCEYSIRTAPSQL